MKVIDQLPMILTPKDVQDFLGFTQCQTYSLFASKTFPSVKVGNKYIIPKYRFLRWLGCNDDQE